MPFRRPAVFAANVSEAAATFDNAQHDFPQRIGSPMRRVACDSRPR
ncbi:MAG: hypothetical protein WAQ05_20970 [Rubrivivax sp.]